MSEDYPISQTPMQCTGNSCDPRQVVNCDREAWVKQSINSAIMLGIEIAKQRTRFPVFESSIEGVVNGTSIEIIRILGMEPEFVNLRRPAIPQNKGGLEKLP